jgi:hypothetical protein
MLLNVPVFGKELGLIGELIINGRKVGATRDFYKVLASPQNLKIFAQAVDLVLGRETFQVEVDDRLSIEEIGKTIHAGHRYAMPPQDYLNAKDKNRKKRTINIVLLPSDQLLKSKDLPSKGNVPIQAAEERIEELKAYGYRPATPKELLFLEKQYPEILQPRYVFLNSKTYHIIYAFGSNLWGKGHNKGNGLFYCSVNRTDSGGVNIAFDWAQYITRGVTGSYLAVVREFE